MIDHAYRVSVISMNIYLIIMNIKHYKSLVTRNRLRRLINTNHQRKKMQNKRKNANSPSD